METIFGAVLFCMHKLQYSKSSKEREMNKDIKPRIVGHRKISLQVGFFVYPVL
jgi:hypothetical protein